MVFWFLLNDVQFVQSIKVHANLLNVNDIHHLHP